MTPGPGWLDVFLVSVDVNSALLAPLPGTPRG
jgi:hypothetical protein